MIYESQHGRGAHLTISRSETGFIITQQAGAQYLATEIDFDEALEIAAHLKHIAEKFIDLGRAQQIYTAAEAKSLKSLVMWMTSGYINTYPSKTWPQIFKHVKRQFEQQEGKPFLYQTSQSLYSAFKRIEGDEVEYEGEKK